MPHPLAGLLARLFFPAVLIASAVACGDSTTGPGDQPFDCSRTLSPGASARDFLPDEDFTRLIIEILLDESIPSPGQSPYTAAEIRTLEQEHRDTYSGEGDPAAYFPFLDGEFGRQNVLGVAYLNTSMAIFGKVIRDNTGGFGQPDTWVIEATSMRHEAGHILGLVNNGTPMVGEQGGQVLQLEPLGTQDLQANGGR